MMRLAPPAPWLPAEWHGKPIVALLACHSGSPEEGEKAVVKGRGLPLGRDVPRDDREPSRHRGDGKLGEGDRTVEPAVPHDPPEPTGEGLGER